MNGSRVKKLTSTPSPDELLELYALFKQGTKGDVTGSRPGMLDFKGRAKYDAWAGRKGVGKEAAHTALSDIRDSIAELRHYRRFMGELGGKPDA